MQVVSHSWCICVSPQLISSDADGAIQRAGRFRVENGSIDEVRYSLKILCGLKCVCLYALYVLDCNRPPSVINENFMKTRTRIEVKQPYYCWRTLERFNKVVLNLLTCILMAWGSRQCSTAGTEAIQMYLKKKKREWEQIFIFWQWETNQNCQLLCFASVSVGVSMKYTCISKNNNLSKAIQSIPNVLALISSPSLSLPSIHLSFSFQAPDCSYDNLHSFIPPKQTSWLVVND